VSAASVPEIGCAPGGRVSARAEALTTKPITANKAIRLFVLMISSLFIACDFPHVVRWYRIGSVASSQHLSVASMGYKLAAYSFILQLGDSFLESSYLRLHAIHAGPG